MIRNLVVSGVLLLAVGASVATTVSRRPTDRFDLSTHEQRRYQAKFVGGKKALAVCIGNGSTFLGLYAYDQYGNCIARDDLNEVGARDDLAVEWYPESDGEYTVEVINFGQRVNQGELALK